MNTLARVRVFAGGIDLPLETAHAQRPSPVETVWALSF